MSKTISIRVSSASVHGAIHIIIQRVPEVVFGDFYKLLSAFFLFQEDGPLFSEDNTVYCCRYCLLCAN